MLGSWSVFRSLVNMYKYYTTILYKKHINKARKDVVI